MSYIKLLQINDAPIAQLKAETGTLEKALQGHIGRHHGTRSGDLQVFLNSIANLQSPKPLFVRAFEDN